MAGEKHYFAKPDTWFDAGTEAVVIAEISERAALFAGMRNGAPDEEACLFDEFEIRLQCDCGLCMGKPTIVCT